MVAAAAWFFDSNGYLLYYGDAQAHLNISRSLIDSRTPGYDQLGTVWLPVLHLICLPFVGKDLMWHSGLAATFPVAACFVLAVAGFYLSAREVYRDSAAAVVSMLCCALNPNVLYLATTAMTEIVFAAGLAICLLAILWFRKTQKRPWIVVAVIASWWMSLTRYDGWFLIPFIALLVALAAGKERLWVFFVSGAAASIAPIYWIAHNWWETANPLDFYDGPYSAAAIQAHRPYPGFHDWPQAIHYYWEAGRACCGNGLICVGILGLSIALWKRWWLPVAFLTLTPLFYVWSVHSSWTPIHLPWLWPHGYYNSRYGIAVVLLMAFVAGATVKVIPLRYRAIGFLVPLLAVFPWVVMPNPANWICWKESQVNSDSRRAWTAGAASFMERRYVRGDGILTEFGDLAGIFCAASLPLDQALHEGNGPSWFANTMPSGIVRQTKWAIAQEGDKLALRLNEGKAFHIVETINVAGAPRLLIYERD